MILRSIFWLFILSLILPDGSFDAAYGTVMRAANGPVEASFGEDVERTLTAEKPKFCDDFPTTCQIASSAKRTIHLQAINLTGALNHWLIAQYEDTEYPSNEEVFDDINEALEPI